MFGRHRGPIGREPEATDAALAHLRRLVEAWAARNPDVLAVAASKADLEGVRVDVTFRDGAAWFFEFVFTNGVERGEVDQVLLQQVEEIFSTRRSDCEIWVSGIIESNYLENGPPGV